jgi:hypothetical protein
MPIGYNWISIKIFFSIRIRTNAALKKVVLLLAWDRGQCP